MENINTNRGKLLRQSNVNDPTFCPDSRDTDDSMSVFKWKGYIKNLLQYEYMLHKKLGKYC